MPPFIPISGLTNAVANGDVDKMFVNLLQRISDRDLERTAEDMYEELKDAGHLTLEERHVLFRSVLEKRSQRLWNMARYFIAHLKGTLPQEMVQWLSPKLDALVSFDAASINGLSTMASKSYGLAFEAMLSQMLKDYDDEKLDVRRLCDLVGGTAGVAVVSVIFDLIIDD